MEKALNEFIETYIEGSAIEEIKFNNKSKNWTVKYNYDVPSDEFETAKDMINFFDADQFGD